MKSIPRRVASPGGTPKRIKSWVFITRAVSRPSVKLRWIQSRGERWALRGLSSIRIWTGSGFRPPDFGFPCGHVPVDKEIVNTAQHQHRPARPKGGRPRDALGLLE